MYIPKFTPGEAITCIAGAGGVKEGQVVKVSGDYTVVAATGGESKAIGVAARTALQGERVAIWFGKVVHSLTVADGARVTAGDVVSAVGGGKVGASSGAAYGVVIKGAGEGAKADIIRL